MEQKLSLWAPMSTEPTSRGRDKVRSVLGALWRTWGPVVGALFTESPSGARLSCGRGLESSTQEGLCYISAKVGAPGANNNVHSQQEV